MRVIRTLDLPIGMCSWQTFNSEQVNPFLEKVHMKKILTLLSAVAGLMAITPSTVEANGCFYVGPIGGANWLQTDKKDRHGNDECGDRIEFETGYNVGGFVGYHFCFGLNVEAEIIYRHNDLKRRHHGSSYSDSYGSSNSKVNFQSVSYMANVIYDISLPSCWCMPIFPYVGAGIGYAQQELRVWDFKKKENGFAWQVLAGIGYQINPNFDIALDYHFNEGRTRRIYNHSLSLAAAYKFSL